MNKRFYLAVAATLLLTRGGCLFAVENIEFNGFLAVGATRSNSSTDSQNGNITDDINFDQDSRVGIQVSADINSRMSVTAQLLGTNREDGNFDTTFDWGYISYALTENVNIRGGKIKFPTFLVSDYIEVGYAYPWIRPPAEVYTSNPITAISGADVLFRAQFGSTDLLVQPYFGTANDQDALVPQEVLPMLGLSPGSVKYENFDAKDMAGINIALSSDFATLRAGYLQTRVSASAFGVNNEDVTFWSVGANMDWHNIIAYSEYFQRDIDGLANAFFPNQKGWYGTLGYRIDRFLPHITFAQLLDDNSSNDPGTGLEQDSLTLGVRYELGTGAALKVEAERVEPKSGSRGLFMAPIDDINIYSVAVDVIF
ncbi:MAG: porin [Thiogranum sp.]